MYIDGAWVDASDGGLLDVVDPATEEVVARVANGGRADAETAVAAGPPRLRRGALAAHPAAGRAEYLRAAAALLRERADELARWETLEMGKLMGDGRGDMLRVADLLDYAGKLAVEHLADQPITGRPPWCASRWAWSSASAPGTSRSCWRPSSSPRPWRPATW